MEPMMSGSHYETREATASMARDRKRLMLIAAAMLAATGLVMLALQDDKSPAVSWVAPLPNGVDVDPGAAVTVTFSEDIDPASIGGKLVRLSAAGVPVEASVSYDKWTRSAVLAPAMPLASATTYTATPCCRCPGQGRQRAGDRPKLVVHDAGRS